MTLASRFTNRLTNHVVRRCQVTRKLSTSRRCSQSWSFSHGVDDRPLLGATIGKLLEDAAATYGEDEAYVSVHQGLRYSFRDLLSKSDDLAAGLMKLGVKRGDRVGIWAPNIMEWVLAQYGTARAGIVLVNINPAYRVNELEYAIKKVGVKVLIATETFKTSNYYHMLHEIIPDLSSHGLDKIKSDRLPDLQHVIIIGDTQLDGTYRFDDVLNMGTPDLTREIHAMQSSLQFDDVINIQFTSGTTGAPKGASLTHHNIVNNSKYVGHMLDFHNIRTRITMPVPLYHCFGMVLGSLTTVTHGTTVVLPSPSFEPEACLKATAAEKCRAMYGTPTMFIDMLEVPNLKQYDLTSLATGIMAGSICPIEVMKKVRTDLHMPDVTICYGTTETSPVSFQTGMDVPVEKRVSTVGQVHKHIEAKVINDDGKIVARGEKGELCVRGYCVMVNYWDEPDKTRDAIGEDRWYKSGDIAIMDDEGYIQIVGRMKDMVIRGGENIYPIELENLLYKHSKISDVQVIGVPDRRMGEEVCAWIKLKHGESATVEEIKTFCKDKISHFKIPRYIQFVDEFPMTVTGKIQKYKMREIAIKELEL